MAGFQPPSAQADPIIPSYIYGIDDNNSIWQINPKSGEQSFVKVYDTPLVTGSNTSNAFAFDRVRDQMFFLNRTGTFESQAYQQALFLWDKPQESFALLASGTAIGLSGTGTAIPANAAFYQDAFWHFNEGTFNLYKVGLTYSGSVPTGVSGLEQFVMHTGTASIAPSNNAFGDIAINVATGTLYGYTSAGQGGRFYSLGLGNPPGGILSDFTLISQTPGTGLQLSFNENFTVLYGHNYEDGKWYEIDTTTGGLTDLNFSTLVPGTGRGFRDLGGASATFVPEPGTIALLAAGGLAVVGARLGRRRAWRQ